MLKLRRWPDADSYGDANTDCNSNANGDAYSNRDANADSDSDAYSRPELYDDRCFGNRSGGRHDGYAHVASQSRRYPGNVRS